MRVTAFLIAVGVCAISESYAWAGPYAPPAGQVGSTAVANTSPAIVEWANGFQDLVRGPLNIANLGLGQASFGAGNDALGFADGVSSHVVSLGDGGRITLTFAQPIANASGFDFAVFENGFGDSFLELAFVEVSSNGTDFVRFPAVSLTQTTTQIGGFGTLDATNLDNLAGKYRAGFGTPFDLSQVAGLSPNVDVSDIRFVRMIDVVGSIDRALGSQDSLNNLINDPYSTPFASGGFDLDGVGVLNQVPEPSSAILFALGVVILWRWKNRRRC
jgi:hypothetical protein